ncbi:MAG TPA: hypothetical protein VHI99_25210 [Vicinamibacterales bacterium]|jgi:hypothetical protein|nr:hypothetical protein [Vicinamibacterales bacterium]
MQRLTRPERIAVWIWVGLALFVGNAVYDLLLTRGIKEYLLRHALHDAGRGPAIPLVDLMNAIVLDATWIGLLFGSVVLLAGMLTVKLVKTPRSAP